MKQFEPYLKNITGVILAGGRGSRFGEPKARTILAGKPLIHHVADAFGKLFSEVMIIGGNESVAEGLNIPVVPDVLPGLGPLGGIHAGLTHAKTDYIFVTACDQPFASAQLVRAMSEAALSCGALVPRTQPFLYPLFACYSKRCLPAIEAQLARGELQVRRFYSEVDTRFADREWLESFDPGLHSLFNINTQSDFEEARRIAAMNGQVDLSIF